MRLYNSLTHSIDELKPVHGKKIGMYTCGPTVYDHAHIGNFRTFIMEDLLKRVLLHEGYDVKHVMNITDVGHLVGDGNIGEDKLLKTAKEEHKSMSQVAEFYTKRFLEDSRKLNLTEPAVLCKATDHIREMLDMIDVLDMKGFIYKISTGMYFDTSKLSDYGVLMGMTFERLNKSLIQGARVEKVEGIRNKTDFAVWRFLDTESGEMEWDSKYGRGFPGWHIECSAISMKYLGKQFDIHCGGVDHLPIHHTNEIAQSEAANGKNPARFWWHAEFLMVDGRKMSKSLGNFYTIESLEEKGYTPAAFKYLILSGHYKQQSNFTLEAMNNASNTLKGIYSFLRALEDADSDGSNQKFINEMEEHKHEFFSELANDLNTPKAFAAMHSIISGTNKRLKAGSLSPADAGQIRRMMLEIDEVLGLGFGVQMKSSHDDLPDGAKELLKRRESARDRKDFKESDKIRKELLEKYNITVEDTKSGTKWHFS